MKKQDGHYDEQKAKEKKEKEELKILEGECKTRQEGYEEEKEKDTVERKKET